MGKMDLKIGKMRRSLDDEKSYYEPVLNMQKPNLQKKEDQFDIRRQILELGCKNLQKMQELVDEGDFDKLLRFHEDIYNRKNLKNIEEKICKGPSSDKNRSKVRKNVLLDFKNIKASYRASQSEYILRRHHEHDNLSSAKSRDDQLSRRSCTTARSSRTQNSSPTQKQRLSECFGSNFKKSTFCSEH